MTEDIFIIEPIFSRVGRGSQQKINQKIVGKTDSVPSYCYFSMKISTYTGQVLYMRARGRVHQTVANETLLVKGSQSKRRVHQLHRKYTTGAPNSRKHTRVESEPQMNRKFATAEEVV